MQGNLGDNPVNAESLRIGDENEVTRLYSLYDAARRVSFRITDNEKHEQSD